MGGIISRPADALFIGAVAIPLVFWPSWDLLELLGVRLPEWLFLTQLSASCLAFFGWGLYEFFFTKKLEGHARYGAVLMAVGAAVAWTTGWQVAGAVLGAVVLLIGQLF